MNVITGTSGSNSCLSALCLHMYDFYVVVLLSHEIENLGTNQHCLPSQHSQYGKLRDDDLISLSIFIFILSSSSLSEFWSDEHLGCMIVHGTNESFFAVNADVPERFSRSALSQLQDIEQHTISRRPALDLSIRGYMRALVRSKDASSWLGKREIPSSAEIMGITSDDGNGIGENEIGLNVNKIDTPWDSKEQYLGAHYGLVREDAIAPLRDAVAEVKNQPNLMEQNSTDNAAIYEKVGHTSLLHASLLRDSI